MVLPFPVRKSSGRLGGGGNAHLSSLRLCRRAQHEHRERQQIPEGEEPIGLPLQSERVLDGKAKRAAARERERSDQKRLSPAAKRNAYQRQSAKDGSMIVPQYPSRSMVLIVRIARNSCVSNPCRLVSKQTCATLNDGIATFSPASRTAAPIA